MNISPLGATASSYPGDAVLFTGFVLKHKELFRVAVARRLGIYDSFQGLGNVTNVVLGKDHTVRNSYDNTENGLVVASGLSTFDQQLLALDPLD